MWKLKCSDLLLPRHPNPLRQRKNPNYIIKRSQSKKEEIVGAGKHGTQLSVQPMKINVCYNKNPQNVFAKIQFYIWSFKSVKLSSRKKIALLPANPRLEFFGTSSLSLVHFSERGGSSLPRRSSNTISTETQKLNKKIVKYLSGWESKLTCIKTSNWITRNLQFKMHHIDQNISK